MFWRQNDYRIFVPIFGNPFNDPFNERLKDRFIGIYTSVRIKVHNTTFQISTKFNKSHTRTLYLSLASLSKNTAMLPLKSVSYINAG
jgi:hypothetical protein